MTRSEPSVLPTAPEPDDLPDPDGIGPGGVWPPPGPAGTPSGLGRFDPPTLPLPPAEAPTDVPDAQPRAGPRRRRKGGTGREAGERGAAGEGRTVGVVDLPLELPPSGPVDAALRRLLPASWRGARLDPGRPGATALALVAAVAAVVAAVGVWFERPRADPAPALPAITVTAAEGGGAPAAPTPVPAATAAAPAEPPAVLVVSVSGKVHRPGLVEVPEGARVADVLEAAGGALPGTDLSAINLARRVVDGEQVAVGVPAAPDAVPPAAPGPAAPSPGSGPAGKVDLNAATVEQLDALPGVGPDTAQRIVVGRARHGRFSRVEQLREVEGIGERRFSQLRELVEVGR